MEEFVSGYCRVLDGPRTVLADLEDKTADCCYPDCPHCEQCTLAAHFRELFSGE